MTSPLMPTWLCHKKVRAFEIGAVVETYGTYGTLLIAEGNEDLCIEVSDGYMEKHKPQVRGYYVCYEDGYESYSPAEAFEAGYTLYEGETP